MVQRNTLTVVTDFRRYYKLSCGRWLTYTCMALISVEDLNVVTVGDVCMSPLKPVELIRSDG